MPTAKPIVANAAVASLILLVAACFVVGGFPDLLLGDALWVQLCTVTGLSLILVAAGASSRTARGSS